MGLLTALQRGPWCLWQDYWPWRNRETSAAQEAERGDLNLLGIKMMGRGFPRNPKFLFSNWIWMGSPPLQGGFKNSDLSFLKRERFSILSHTATDQGAQTREKSLLSSYIFSTPGMTLLYSVNARIQVPSGLCTFLELVFILPDLPWLSGSRYCSLLLLLVNSGPYWD